MSRPQPRPLARTPIVVLKFGGTSVRSAERWATVATVAQSRLAEGFHPVLVCSAIAGTSDHLEALLDSVDDPEASQTILSELRADHWRLARELDLDAPALLGAAFDHLAKLIESIRVLGEIPPRTRAQVMSVGELLSTRLGAAWMQKAGLPVRWQDARQWLRSEPQDAPGRHYLSATCAHERRPDLIEQVLATHEIIVTQGFIARDEEGDTVLLGRGGSDTSAAYLSAILGATRLEIWTDVPGMFTSNPRDVAGARLLRKLSWAEAEALATLGASVLHPRCIAPMREAGIPLHIRCTHRTELPGTRIDDISDTPAIRAVVLRNDLRLITMTRPPCWQEVGFLADVTSCFQRHDLSIDMLCTSPGQIQVTLDPAAAPGAEEGFPALMADLDEVCEPQLTTEMASVSVVGTAIRELLPRIGEALKPLQDADVGLVVQGASDTHLTFVVPASDAKVLARDLHRALFDGHDAPGLGETWEVLHKEVMASRPDVEAQPGDAA